MTNIADLESKWQRALAFHKAGQPDKAEPLYQEVLAVSPGLVQAWNLLGVARAQMGRAADGLAAFDRALALKPDLTEALTGRAKLLWSLGRFEEAVAAYDQALAASPWDAEAWNYRGGALSFLGRGEEAMQSFTQAVAIRPDYWEAWNNRGVLAQQLKRHAESLKSFEQVLSLNPGLSEALSNRAVTLSEMGRFEEALADIEKALETKPDAAEHHYNRAGMLADLGRFEDALTAYDRANALKPDYAEAQYNQSLLLLLMGRFAPGWRQYEWRKRRGMKMTTRDHPEPHWLGEDISGKTLLVYWEQGLGDTIQFSRLASQAASRGAKVFLSVQAPLLRLLASMDTNVQVIGPSATPAEFDYQSSLMSLPLALGIGAETISGPPYLKTDEELEAEWTQRLGPKTKPRIGLAWSGGVEHRDDHNRSIALGMLLPLIDGKAEWFSLQKEVRADDQAALERSGLVSFADKLRDFADTAALIEQMDLVISVDTSVAHLAGALGKKTWILLPWKPDWRWRLGREDSPWYQSVRLFRQDRRGNWASVVKKVKGELDGLTADFG
jgi:tetratricopeptide (TPR) repeat protein